MNETGEQLFRSADSLHSGAVILERNSMGRVSHHHHVVNVYRPDKASPVGKPFVQPGKIHIRIRGIKNLWVFDAGAEVEVKPTRE